MGNYINYYCVYEHKRVNSGTKRFTDTRFNLPESCVVYIIQAQISCNGIEITVWRILYKCTILDDNIYLTQN